MYLKYAVVFILAIITLVLNFGSRKLALKLFPTEQDEANGVYKIKLAALILCIFTFALALLLF